MVVIYSSFFWDERSLVMQYKKGFDSFVIYLVIGGLFKFQTFGFL
jgi:hypothetical protein